MLSDYLFLTLSAVLCAINFVFSKIYQEKVGNTLFSGTYFNLLNGFFSIFIYFALNNFKLEYSTFSAIIALLQTMCAFAYCVLGFAIMEKGKLTHYTLFLMSGGMVVPYIYGIIFLNEQVTEIRFLGVLLILLAVFLSNSGSNDKLDAKTLLYCVLVFLLNGIACAFTKVHQIGQVVVDGATYENVSSAGYGVLTGIGKCIEGAVLLIIIKFKGNSFHLSAAKEGLFVKSLPVVFGCAFVSALCYKLQLDCAVRLPATVFFPIVTGGTIVFTALCGRIAFKEKLTKKIVICICMCVIGTLLFL